MGDGSFETIQVVTSALQFPLHSRGQGIHTCRPHSLGVRVERHQPRPQRLLGRAFPIGDGPLPEKLLHGVHGSSVAVQNILRHRNHIGVGVGLANVIPPLSPRVLRGGYRRTQTPPVSGASTACTACTACSAAGSSARGRGPSRRSARAARRRRHGRGTADKKHSGGGRYTAETTHKSYLCQPSLDGMLGGSGASTDAGSSPSAFERLVCPAADSPVLARLQSAFRCRALVCPGPKFSDPRRVEKLSQPGCHSINVGQPLGFPVSRVARMRRAVFGPRGLGSSSLAEAI